MRGKLNKLERILPEGLLVDSGWMNENGYKRADRHIFELYHNNFNDHPEKKAIVDFYIPVE